jgi:uncharacterized protein (TIGR00725 family)
MGSGEGATPTDLDCAYRLGNAIAQAGWLLLTGGRAVGVMDAASRGAVAAGGVTIGILPGTDYHGLSPAITIPILTGMGNARNAINVLSSQVIITCGMGAGTASEIALAIKSSKPVILLNAPPEAQAFFLALSPSQVQVADSVEGAIELVYRRLDHDL